MRVFALVNDKAGFETNATNQSALLNNALFHLRGKEIEVETDYLFLDQLNTVPFEYSKNGLRLLFHSIKSIRIENRTFQAVKNRLKKHYKYSWNKDIKDTDLYLWQEKTGIITPNYRYFKRGYDVGGYVLPISIRSTQTNEDGEKFELIEQCDNNMSSKEIENNCKSIIKSFNSFDNYGIVEIINTNTKEVYKIFTTKK